MHFYYEQLSRNGLKKGVYTNTNPCRVQWTLSPNEIQLTGVYVDVATVSAGIGALNPALITMRFSPDGGEHWYAVSPLTATDIDAVGQFSAQVGGTQVVGPLMEVTVTPPAGETIEITEIWNRKVKPGMVASLLGSGAAGLGSVDIRYLRGIGGAYTPQQPIFDLSTPTNMRPMPVTIVPDGLPETSQEEVIAIQHTISPFKVPVFTLATTSVMLGWDDSAGQHLEPAVDSVGRLLVKARDKAVSETIYNDYTVTNVTTGAWVEILAATADDVTEIEIFDSSGSLLELGVGAVGSEARKVLVIPGGNGRIPIDIASGTRLSLRAVDVGATVGFFAANVYKN